MRLIGLQVKNYKCIEDTEAFAISDLTCLAGKNESGKTAILTALYRLNPVDADEHDFNATMEYPRQRYSEFQEGSEPSEVLVTEWELDAEDLASVEAVVGTGAMKSNTVKIKRGYENKQTWLLGLDERVVLSNLADRHKLTDAARKRLLETKQLDAAIAALKASGPTTKGEKALLDEVGEYRNERVALGVIDVLSPRVPKFLYFPDYESLPGRVAVNELAPKLENDQPLDMGEKLFVALLSLVGTTVAEIKDTQLSEELDARLEAVRNRLTKEIFEFWSQNRQLRVDFRYSPGLPQDDPPFNSGYVFRTRIENLRHGVSVSFDERSAGFIWFFSFLIWFSQMKEEYGDRLVILLDEPGLNLHGKAQADLLRYLKERLISKEYQVIYTTHSPFMIDVDDLLGVRTVEDVVGADGVAVGTKVGDQVLSTDPDTIFPLRAALGYDITQSLFVGENCLLVEGPSDLLYLRWASNALSEAGRPALSSRWTITPVGGIDKMRSFAALFGGNNLHVALLADHRKGVKGKVRELRERILEESRVMTADAYAGQPEADIEDILGAEFYVGLVNRCYDLDGPAAVEAPGAGAPVMPHVEAHFRTLPPDAPEFDHFRPAAFLIERWGDLRGDLPDADGALARMEGFFVDANAALPT